MKRTQAATEQNVQEDSMNTRRTLRKAIVGLLKQTAPNGTAVAVSTPAAVQVTERNLTDASATTMPDPRELNRNS